MVKNLIGFNSVVLAKNLNPSIFFQYWFIKNGILKDTDFQPGSIYTDQMVQINAKEFNVLITPQQLQFYPKSSDWGYKTANEFLSLVLSKVQHTPFTALGINFTWHVEEEKELITSFSKRLFFNPSNKLNMLFDSENSQYGLYMSRNFEANPDVRVKLTITPNLINASPELMNIIPSVRKNVIQFQFNYHLDYLPEKDTFNKIESFYKMWDILYKDSLDTLNVL